MRITDSDAELNRVVTLPQHRQVCDAILARDAGAAQAAMEAHLADAALHQTELARHPPAPADAREQADA